MAGIDLTAEPPAPSKRSLLIVEDEEDVRYFLGHWIRRQGLLPVLAKDAREAMELLGDMRFIESSFDALLVDYRLPDATGCRIVRACLDESPRMPVALMTAYFDLSLELWLRARNVPLMRKPLDLGQLRAWLERIPVAT
ncbi:MAG: response regulator [Planctomycetota bacterium]|nr:response regulator [Planctomycetota bacterium]